MRIRLILIHVLLLIPLFAHAQWKASLKNIALGPFNTLLFLENNNSPLQLAPHRYRAEVSFRPSGSYHYLYRKEHFFDLAQGGIHEIPFQIKADAYQVDVDLLDLDSKEHFTLTLNYESTIKANQVGFSDIFLFYSPPPENESFIANNSILQNTSPILKPTLQPDRTQLYFRMDIYAKQRRKFLMRAVIYKENPGVMTDQATSYTSEAQIYGYPEVIDGQAVYTDNFEVDQLSEGEYLLSIYIYDENEVYVDERRVNFIVEGSIKQRIYNDLPRSIEMMKYNTFATARIDSLQEIDDETQQRIAFEQAWQKLYGRYFKVQLDETAEARMEAYYQRVFEAEDLLTESGEAWDSDRGEKYILYGKPTQRIPLEMNGQIYERWVYLDWDLSFLFEKRNQAYVLVE